MVAMTRERATDCVVTPHGVPGHCLRGACWATSWHDDVIRPVVGMWKHVTLMVTSMPWLSWSPACRLTQAFFVGSDPGDIHGVEICRFSTKFGDMAGIALRRQIRLKFGRVRARQTPACGKSTAHCTRR
jgi:hypothetical protein